MKKDTIHTQRVCPTRISNNFKYLCPNMRAANYINQLITKSKKHIDNNTIIVGDFNTPLIEMDRPSKQKINKEIKA